VSRLERFPSVTAPDRVGPGAEVAVEVSLTVRQETPEVSIRSGEATPAGAVALTLPAAERWTLDVALAAPGFEILEGANFQEIELAPSGDSTSALFMLRAPRTAGRREIFVTFWHQRRFIAKVVRPIAVGPGSGEVAVERVGGPSVGRPAVLERTEERPPDLTVWVIGAQDPQRSHEATFLVQSLAAAPIAVRWDLPPDLDAWLASRYAVMARTARGARPAAGQGTGLPAATLRGFGKEVHDRILPPAVREILRTQRIETVQVFTTDPRIPWELALVTPPGGESALLGQLARVARWHISTSGDLPDRPSPAVHPRAVLGVVPRYRGDGDLPAASAEVARIERALGERVHPVPATREALRAALGSSRPGVLHFAGHGSVARDARGTPAFAIELEDGPLDLIAWKGLGIHLPSHPLVFLNACEVGQAVAAGGFVDGWGPALLEAGASGFVGSLWPVDDRAAAAFAELFYEAIATKDVGVAEAIRRIRSAPGRAGDPTFAGYVFYGDVAQRMEWKRAR
jgi:hypothetical protein